MMQILSLLTNLILGSLLLISGVWLFSHAAGSMFNAKLPEMFRANSPVKIFWVSTAITALLQSSTAISLLTVSFAESGILTLPSAMAAIYGANLGTCVTAQIMSLDITEHALNILLAGAFLRITAIFVKPLTSVSEMIAACGMLFSGLMTLNLSVPIIKGSPLIMYFINIHGENRLALIITGFVLTALINSSSATVGLTMTLFAGGVLSLTQAVYIVFGDNIGTCVTALIASQGAGVTGKRVALGHILYNGAGTLIACIFADSFIYAVIFITRLFNQPDYYLVANAHLLFNLLGGISFMPINNRFCALLEKLYK